MAAIWAQQQTINKYSYMTIEEIIRVCKNRGELDFLYNLTKIVAESDSIGEGYGYCDNYSLEMFNNGEMHIEREEFKARGFKDHYDLYLEEGGIPLYELYLKQIKAI